MVLLTSMWYWRRVIPFGSSSLIEPQESRTTDVWNFHPMSATVVSDLSAYKVCQGWNLTFFSTGQLGRQVRKFSSPDFVLPALIFCYWPCNFCKHCWFSQSLQIHTRPSKYHPICSCNKDRTSLLTSNKTITFINIFTKWFNVNIALINSGRVNLS